MSVNKSLQLSKAIVKHFGDTKGFDRIMHQVVLTAASPGVVKAQFVVGEEHVNAYGTLHGGYTACLVDMLTTVGLMNSEPSLPGVSVDLSVSYMKAAKLGETVTIDAVTLKKGTKLGFCTVDFRNSAGQLLAQGKHTKYLDLAPDAVKTPLPKQ